MHLNLTRYYCRNYLAYFSATSEMGSTSLQSHVTYVKRVNFNALSKLVGSLRVPQFFSTENLNWVVRIVKNFTRNSFSQACQVAPQASNKPFIFINSAKLSQLLYLKQHKYTIKQDFLKHSKKIITSFKLINTRLMCMLVRCRVFYIVHIGFKCAAL